MAKKPTTKKQSISDTQMKFTTSKVVPVQEPLQSVLDNQATLVLPEALNELQTRTDSVELIVEPTLDKQTLKDAWDRPIPTKVVLIEALNFHSLTAKVLYAASLGAKLDPTFDVRIHIPYLARILLPEENYGKYLAEQDKLAYNSSVQYNKVIIKAHDRNEFFKAVMEVGNSGVVLDPAGAAMKTPYYSVTVLTRKPLQDNINVTVGWQKVTYTAEELESFGIIELTTICKWHKIPTSKSKDKCIKLILEFQEEKKKDVE